MDKKVNQLEVNFANELRQFFLSLESKLLLELENNDTSIHLNTLLDTEWEKYTQIVYTYKLQATHLGESLQELLTQNRLTIKSNPQQKKKKTTPRIPLYKIPYTVEWEVYAYAEVSSTYVRKRYGEKINNILKISYEQGLGITDTRDMIKKVNNNFKNYEAHRIARTEIQSSRNEAHLTKMKTEGTEYKQWITMQDERVRGNKPNDSADHTVLDGEICAVDQPFSNGLMYPGDKNGDISEWINCRCSCVDYILLGNETAPPDMTHFTEADIIRN